MGERFAAAATAYTVARDTARADADAQRRRAADLETKARDGSEGGGKAESEEGLGSA